MNDYRKSTQCNICPFSYVLKHLHSSSSDTHCRLPCNIRMNDNVSAVGIRGWHSWAYLESHTASRSWSRKGFRTPYLGLCPQMVRYIRHKNNVHYARRTRFNSFHCKHQDDLLLAHIYFLFSGLDTLPSKFPTNKNSRIYYVFKKTIYHFKYFVSPTKLMFNKTRLLYLDVLVEPSRASPWQQALLLFLWQHLQPCPQPRLAHNCCLLTPLHVQLFTNKSFIDFNVSTRL